LWDNRRKKAQKSQKVYLKAIKDPQITQIFADSKENLFLRRMICREKA
jgi:hypothetical protein